MKNSDTSLHILWTSGEIDTAEKMVMMYGHNALKKGWWESVTIIIWGAATALTAENEGLQKKIREMMDDGIDFTACKACADQLGAAELLESMGVEVRYWGEPLTRLIQEKKNLLTV